MSIEKKINNFIEECCKDKIIKSYVSSQIRSLIEKIAIWYELRYPDYEIKELMPCCGKKEMDINSIMFKDNPYINELLEEKTDIQDLDWDDFYNADVFIRALPWEERHYLEDPEYMSILYINPDRTDRYLYLSEDGFVKNSEGITAYTGSIITDEELIGLNIKRVLEIFNERNVDLPASNDLEPAIKRNDNLLRQKERILNCAMYRIIERGGWRIGPRRAFLFAKEFNLNIDIPMMFGVDFTDPGLRLFINDYIKAGGSKKLMCYVNYFSNSEGSAKLQTISIQDLILTLRNSSTSFYTEEEHALHQRLVNSLASTIDYEKLRQERIKQSRIKRKLGKNK